MFLSVILFTLAFTSNAQNDTMYIMKDGLVVRKYNVNTDLDSIVFYKQTIAARDTFTDTRDSTIYSCVTIGNQVWMAENLKYLPSVTGPVTASNSEPYYYVYGYNGTDVTEAKATENYHIYGVLYNWPAAMAGATGSNKNPSGVQGICPTGWHMPSDEEWSELRNYLGDDDAGGKLKETGTTHWNDPNEGATNETGFTALPGGVRSSYGAFYEIGSNGVWWTTTESLVNEAYVWTILYFSSTLGCYNTYMELGCSIRCVRD